MTRGGRCEGERWGVEWGRGVRYWRCDTRGFESTKTHDDTGLQTPPEKKFQKKFFGVQLFFQEKIFSGLGGFCHHGFFI